MINLIEHRHCGNCFACCKILNIDSGALQKEADVLCPNYQHSLGCKIYDQRPEQCRQWYCGWRLLDALPDDYSPDKINIAFCMEKSPKNASKMIIVARAYEMDYETAFATKTARHAFDLLIEAGHEVWLSNGILKTPIERGKPLPVLGINKKTETPRNSLCPCGSGQRYKYCCGKLV